jgi:hypothetical protein
MPRGAPRGRAKELRRIGEFVMARPDTDYCDDCLRKLVGVPRVLATEQSLQNLAKEHNFVR